MLQYRVPCLPGPEEPASLTLAAVKASTDVQLTFHCASRAAERPWTPKGPPIQFVHIHKAGGTSLYELFGYGVSVKPRADMRGVHICLHNFFVASPPAPVRTNFPVLKKGTIYIGHRPVGFGALSAQAKPLYIVVLREPLARTISLYDYMATSSYRTTRSVRMQQMFDMMKHLQTRAEPAARAAGVPSTHLFEWLLARDDPVARHIAFNDSQLDYLVPVPHNHPCTTDRLNAVRMAAHVLLRADVVAVTEENSLLMPQLRLHSPAHFSQNITVPHANSKRRLPAAEQDHRPEAARGAPVPGPSPHT